MTGASANLPETAATLARSATSIRQLDAVIADCRACPRLVAWREHIAGVKRAAFLDWDYWGRPVPGLGPDDAALAIVGLAPAAHGANRTGRMFTGDRSGDVLFAALHAVGLASQPTSVHAGDGLSLRGVRITAPVHCAPPANKPTVTERDTCSVWLAGELSLLRPTLRTIVVLGRFGWQAVLPVLHRIGWPIPGPAPAFGHGARYRLAAARSGGPDLELIGCYHVSQQNTFTGRLTPAMLVELLEIAKASADRTSRGG